MSGDDKVHLFFVTEANHLCASYMKRSVASDIIANWYKMREYIRIEDPDNAAGALNFLTYGTFAYNVNGFSNWTIGWEHVHGMYIREIEQTPQERAAAAAEKLAEAMSSSLSEGEDWKKGKPADEEENVEDEEA